MTSRGKIKQYNGERGFGFVTPDDGGEDLFFHFTAVSGGVKLAKGDIVDYVPDTNIGNLLYCYPKIVPPRDLVM